RCAGAAAPRAGPLLSAPAQGGPVPPRGGGGRHRCAAAGPGPRGAATLRRRGDGDGPPVGEGPPAGHARRWRPAGKPSGAYARPPRARRRVTAVRGRRRWSGGVAFRAVVDLDAAGVTEGEPAGVGTVGGHGQRGRAAPGDEAGGDDEDGR